MILRNSSSKALVGAAGFQTFVRLHIESSSYKKLHIHHFRGSSTRPVPHSRAVSDLFEIPYDYTSALAEVTDLE